jgi:hypothetical protein
MLHDMTKNDKWLHFSTNTCEEFLDCGNQREVPIATLLCLADNLELGKRPKFRKRVRDKQCTFLIEDTRERMIRIEYDESNKCLIL